MKTVFVDSFVMGSYLFGTSCVAQVPDLTWSTALVYYGPMAGMLIWFAARSEKKSDKMIEQLQKNHDEMIREIRATNHSIYGLSRSLLATEIGRDGNDNNSKRLAQEILSQEDGRMAKTRQ